MEVQYCQICVVAESDVMKVPNPFSKLYYDVYMYFTLDQKCWPRCCLAQLAVQTSHVRRLTEYLHGDILKKKQKNKKKPVSVF